MSEPEHGSLAWRKSTASDSGGNCVEVAIGGDSVYVRNARDRGGPMLRFLHHEWAAFLAGVHSGEFELPAPPTLAEGS